MTRLQIEISLGLLFVLLAATILVIAGAGEQARMEAREFEQLAESVEHGAELFEGRCAPCHGQQGKGITNLAPALNEAEFFTQRVNEVGWEGTLEDYIISMVSSGRAVSTRPDLYPGQGIPAMPAWSEEFGGPLRPDQIRDIANYVLNWQEAAIEGIEIAVLPTPTPAADDPVARGRGVYVERGCGACHVITGVSEGLVGPTLNNIGETATTRVEGLSAEEYIRQSILVPNSYLVEGYSANQMPQNFGDIISEPQLNDLVEFLLSQK